VIAGQLRSGIRGNGKTLMDLAEKDDIATAPAARRKAKANR